MSVSSTGQTTALNASETRPSNTTLLDRANAPLQSTAGENIDNDPNAQPNGPANTNLTDSSKDVEQRQELEQVKQLAAIDRDVRAHEAAHAASGGNLAGSPTYSFTRGPDGKLYATSGEVSIDTSPVSNDPEATIQKAQTIIQAALAPANPSQQDIQVAAQAQAMLIEAQSQVLRQEAENPLAEAEAEETNEGEREEQDPDSPSAIQQNQDSINDRLERSREQREAFAEQLQELNRRLSGVQQQLIDIGAIDSLQPQGSFLDLVV